LKAADCIQQSLQQPVVKRMGRLATSANSSPAKPTQKLRQGCTGSTSQKPCQQPATTSGMQQNIQPHVFAQEVLEGGARSAVGLNCPLPQYLQPVASVPLANVLQPQCFMTTTNTNTSRRPFSGVVDVGQPIPYQQVMLPGLSSINPDAEQARASTHAFSTIQHW
jgi:hypothetical protein